MKIIIDNITLDPGAPEDSIEKILKKDYGLTRPRYEVVRKSLDARKRNRIVYRYRIAVETDEATAARLLEYENIDVYEEKTFPMPVRAKHPAKVIVVGSGPAGLFSALRLIEGGVKVEIFERGKPVTERMADIRTLEDTGKLDSESNVLFGEGGAGTYSDGKLTTRINRREIVWFYDMLVRFGADRSLLVEARPHLGTENVRKIVGNIREFIESAGSIIRFNERVDECIIRKERIEGVRTSRGRESLSHHVVLATGHSARDTYRMLDAHGITMERKGFAAGVRIEHPSRFINTMQYGNSRYGDILPTADYSLAWNNPKTGRGTYTFCMCPGGMVINSSSQEGRLCLNGMSFSGRDSDFSNSAVVVSVKPEDTGEELFSGIDFQARLEEKAYRSGTGNYLAPAQKALSFMENRTDSHLPPSSYKPGISPADMRGIIPGWMADEIKNALFHFNKKKKGFLSQEALLLAVETRSSSPLRILRNEDYQSVSVKGLFPAGEGAGYSGGIVSSAVDGIRVADIILGSL